MSKPVDIEELERLEKDADASWELVELPLGVDIAATDGVRQFYAFDPHAPAKRVQNLRLAVAARNALPALIQEVRELRVFARSVFAFLPDDQVDAYATEARRLGLLGESK